MSDGDDLTPVLSAMDDTWSSILDLAQSLAPDEFALPTRCPGWDVHDQIAHLASLEQFLAGGELAPEAPDAPHIRNPVGAHMERGVHALRGLAPGELVAVLQSAIEARRTALRANPPKAGDEVLGVMGNPVPAQRSLPIRVFDLWVHEQDIRVATGRPGNEAGPGARVGRDAILSMVPMYWAKEAGAGPGQSLLLRVTGALPFERTVTVGPDGRAAIAKGADAEEGARGAEGASGEPVAVIELAWADLVARTNGRAGSLASPVAVSGNESMARAVVDALPMSP
jgi:uncharacterized protein (TIGR03083 family)